MSAFPRFSNADDHVARHWRRVKQITGATKEEALAKFEAQGGRCAICLTELDPPPARGTHADHCHKRKKFRGYLCSRCNIALGHFDDSITKLLRAIVYLRRGGR